MDDLQAIIDILQDLAEDSTVPKNVKSAVTKTIAILQEEGDLSLKANKALNMLDEAGDDANLQPYTRTQIWSIVSLLEKLH